MKFCTSRNLLIIFVLMSVVTVWGTRAAFGDDGHGHNHHDDGGDTTIGDTNIDVGGTDVSIGETTLQGGDTNVSTGGNKALSLGNSLGDVDIAGCLGSTQWATPVISKQKLVINWPCMAEFYLRNGKHELAAMALCNTEIVKEFSSEAECESAHDFSPPERPPNEPEEPVSQILEQQQIIETEHDEDIQVVQMAQSSLEQRVAALERPRSARPAPSQRFDKERVDAVWLALRGNQDESDE
jgi:hypothetical protein